MNLFKRRQEPSPAIQLLTSDGEHTSLHVTFRNGEIHINSDALDQGTYQLIINHGKNRECKPFTIL
ncbi:MAG: hypothetical protein HKN76_05835 [Saprospiraceae bacterium]|nr:hypothetical protein [Saprospiraceae bacterium]